MDLSENRLPLNGGFLKWGYPQIPKKNQPLLDAPIYGNPQIHLLIIIIINYPQFKQPQI